MKMSDVLEKINGQMHEGRCPQSGCIGECAAIDETKSGAWWAALYIWDNDFNDSTRVAKWFHDLGAVDVQVSHVLYDSANDDRNGRCFDGARAWHVQFSTPPSAGACDGQLERALHYAGEADDLESLKGLARAESAKARHLATILAAVLRVSGTTLVSDNDLHGDKECGIEIVPHEDGTTSIRVTSVAF